MTKITYPGFLAVGSGQQVFPQRSGLGSPQVTHLDGAVARAGLQAQLG